MSSGLGWELSCGLIRRQPPAPLTPDEVQELATKGIDIPLREIGILNYGTFTYKGKRVAVYIRDVASYHNDYSLPKFHLAMCETLLTMKGEGRYEKAICRCHEGRRTF